MTTIESIQMNIHYAKVQLKQSSKVICEDAISKLNNEAEQEHWVNQLEELQTSLKYAIKQKS